MAYLKFLSKLAFPLLGCQGFLGIAFLDGDEVVLEAVKLLFKPFLLVDHVVDLST